MIVSGNASLPKILIVDDRQANLIALEAVLQPLECKVIAAESGAEALALAAADEFALLIVDAHMPMLDGYETVELLRKDERTRNVPVIFLTAVHDSPEHRERGYALGALDFIGKPFESVVLQGKVRAIIALYEIARQSERRRSEERARMKDTFLGAVGHDLRTPLSVIMTAAHLLVAQEKTNPGGAQMGVRIARAARRMNGIIDDILDMTRTQLAGGLTLAPQPANLGDIARAVIDELTMAHPERRVRLFSSGDVRGTWDTSRLARVVSNLVNNAIQHALSDVTVDVRGAEHGVELSVHNSGEPISPLLVPRIFEPFRRGDSSAEGVGLGLFIVREIARAHGGTAEVTSSADLGTTFTIRLPREVPKHA